MSGILTRRKKYRSFASWDSGWPSRATIAAGAFLNQKKRKSEDTQKQSEIVSTVNAMCQLKKKRQLPTRRKRKYQY